MYKSINLSLSQLLFVHIALKFLICCVEHLMYSFNLQTILKLQKVSWIIFKMSSPLLFHSHFLKQLELLKRSIKFSCASNLSFGLSVIKLLGGSSQFYLSSLLSFKFVFILLISKSYFCPLHVLFLQLPDFYKWNTLSLQGS